MNKYKLGLCALIMVVQMENVHAMCDALGTQTPVGEETVCALTPDDVINLLKSTFMEFKNDPTAHEESGYDELTAIRAFLVSLDKKPALSPVAIEETASLLEQEESLTWDFVVRVCQSKDKKDLYDLTVSLCAQVSALNKKQAEKWCLAAALLSGVEFLLIGFLPLYPAIC